MILLVTSILYVACVLFAYMRWSNTNKCLNEPPVYPGAWPVIGHILSLIRGRKKTWQFVRQASYDISQNGGVCRFLLGPQTLYVVCNPDDSLLIANQCIEKSNYYDFSKPWLGESLLIAKGPVWKRDRKLLTPVFNSRVYQNFMETFNREAKRMVDKLSIETDKGSIDHLPYMKEYAMETLCSSVLGMDFDGKTRYMHMTETLMEILKRRILNVMYHFEAIFNWTNLKETQDEYIQFIHQVSDEMIKKKLSEINARSQYEIATEKNLVDFLLELSTSEVMSVTQIRNQLNLMIVGGFQTIGIMLPVIVAMVGSYRAVQENICKELEEVFMGTNRDVEKEDLNKLVYLDAVVNETLRMFPPASIIMRELKQEIKLKNYTLSAGRTCMLSLCGLGLHPIWGDDVLQFRPERWLPPSTPPSHPAAFAAFSLGKRNCIGKYYAMMSIKTALVHVFRNYDIAADWTKIEFGQDVMSRPDSGCRIVLTRRIAS